MEVLAQYKLEAIYDSHKSFYGKAIVKEIKYGDETILQLTSYSTVVAQIVIDEKGKRCEVFGTYSNTTLRHIKEFLYQNGFEVGTKAFIENEYIKENNLYTN